MTQLVFALLDCEMLNRCISTLQIYWLHCVCTCNYLLYRKRTNNDRQVLIICGQCLHIFPALSCLRSSHIHKHSCHSFIVRRRPRSATRPVPASLLSYTVKQKIHLHFRRSKQLYTQSVHLMLPLSSSNKHSSPDARVIASAEPSLPRAQGSFIEHRLVSNDSVS